MAHLARGRVAAARGGDDALDALEAALARFARVGMSVEAARARLELARALEADQPEVAVARREPRSPSSSGSGRSATPTRPRSCCADTA